MFYLKVSGRIITATVEILSLSVGAIKRNIKSGFTEPMPQGKKIFNETGLLADISFGYRLELIKKEEHKETFKKLIYPSDVNYFYTYPKPYIFKGDEYLLYTLREATKTAYIEIPKLEYEDFDVEDLYVGEFVLDDDIGNCGLLSRIYYVPFNDAMLFADTNNVEEVRTCIVNMLKNGKADLFKYYQLNIDAGNSFSHRYYVIKNSNGELFNNWTN